MKEQIIGDIKAYIKFLESVGYAVSLSVMRTPFASYAVELLEFDFHPHTVCSYLKRNPGTAGRCVRNKRAVMRMKLQNPRYACCYAGVEEFLIPLADKGSTILYIHVSGYRGVTEWANKNRARIASRCTEAYSRLYGELSPNPPAMEQVLSFVRPLQYMLLALHRLYLEERENQRAESPSGIFYAKAMQYIHENYPDPITCASIAREMRYSQSYVRYIFQKEGGTSVQAKINQVRLNHAKRLLRGSDMSVTQIAFSVGFADSNYFSSFFKKQEGCSPREYRKRFCESGN